MNILQTMNKKIYIGCAVLILLFCGCEKKVEPEIIPQNDIEDLESEEQCLQEIINETEDETQPEEALFEWEEFQQILGEEDYATLRNYIPIFENEMEFYCFPLNQKCTLADLNNFFEVDTYVINSFTLVDMDDNGDNEIVFDTNIGPGMTFVISEIDNAYFGSYYSARELNELQKNGNFIGSGGADTTYFSRLNISKECFETIIFAERKGWGDEANWTEEYYNQFMEDNYSDVAEWYELSILIQ